MKFRTLTAAIALLALAGCGATQVVYQPVPVDTPVAVPCHVLAVPVPVWPTASVAPGASLFDRAKAVLAELRLRAGYEARLAAANKSCQ